MSQRQAELAFIVSVRSELDTLSRQLDQTKRKLGTVDSGFKNTAKVGRAAETAMLAMGAAAAVGVGYAVKTTMDFDKQMSAVAAKSGATKAELASLRDVAKDLGAKTVFSASESAQGMDLLAAAGFKTNDIITAMPGLLDAAAASGADFATVTDIAVSTLNGFGLKADDMQRVADLLAKGANESAVGFTDLGDSFKYIGPIARTLGFSIEDVTAALAIMGNQGIKGEQAGTSLRQAFVRLVKPPKQAADALEKYNIALYDQKGNMKELPDLLKEFQAKLGGLSDSEKAAAAAAIFGTESVSGMLALINTAPAEIDKMTASMDSADGAASEMAATMTDNLWGAVEELKGSSETAAISVGDALVPTIRDATEWLTEMTDAFNDLSPAEQEAILKTSALVVGLGLGVVGIVKTAQGVKVLIGAYHELAAATALARGGSLAGMAAEFGFVARNITTLSAATTTMGGAAGALSLGLVGLAGAAGYGIGTLVNEIDALKRSSNDLVAHAVDGEELSKPWWAYAGSAGQAAYAAQDLAAHLGAMGLDETNLLTDEAAKKMRDLGFEIDATGAVVGARADTYAYYSRNLAASAAETKKLMDAGRLYRDDVLNSKNADIEAKRAVLDLNDARGRASDALTTYGPTSKEFARAQLEVSSAELRVESAARRATDANEKMKQSLAKVPMPSGGSLSSWITYYESIGEAARVAGVKAMIANKQINGNGLARSSTGSYQIPVSADGRVVSSPLLTWVGEAGDTEVIVPLNNKARSRELAAIAAQGTGLGGGGLTVNIDARGASDPVAIRRAGYDGVNAAVERAQLLSAGGFRQ